jgi:hypothetical protein
MSLYQRGKSWYYDFLYRGGRYTGCIGPILRTVAKEILAKKKAEAVEGRYELPSKKPTPKLEEFAQEYFAYYRANRRPRSAERHETSYHAMRPTFGLSGYQTSRHWPLSATSASGRRKASARQRSIASWRS